MATKSKPTISRFYSLKNILATNSDINLVIGMRSNGKTYGTLKYFLEQYKAERKRFAYIRRWADDLKGFRAEGLFMPLQQEVEKLYGKDYSIVYLRHKYYLCNEAGEKLDIIGYTLALSEAAHTKSVAFENIGYICFDEFIQMAGERKLTDEISKYENTLSTLIRQKQDVKVFLLANTVSKYSPYFSMYGFNIERIAQGSITTNNFTMDDNILTVSLEYCEYIEEIGKNASKYVRSDMIRKGLWEIPPTDDIPSCPNEIIKEQLLFTMEVPDVEDVTVGCYLRTGYWNTLELNKDIAVYEEEKHVRQFLVLRQIERQSKYFHLSQDKSLNYHVYNDLKYFLLDIRDQTNIDVQRELFMGRIFCENMFVADYFNNCWMTYCKMAPRSLL